MDNQKYTEGSDMELEERVLKECIVGTTGLSSQALQVGIKGDPSLRETAMVRSRYRNVMDEIFETIEPQLEELLLNRSTYRLYIGFNSAEVRTCSVFDPLREETHAAERFSDPAYVQRHFPAVTYEQKVTGIRELYRWLRASPLFEHMPDYWQRISEKRALNWQPMERARIPEIMCTLKALREMPDYYLRSVSICIVQGLVRMQFNCDGTQLVDARNYIDFLREHFPE